MNIFFAAGVMIIVAAIFTIIASKIVQRLKWGVLTLIVLMLAAFSGVMTYQMSVATGWDGLLYLAMLIGLSAPAAAGLVLGSLTGWIKLSNARDDAAELDQILARRGLQPGDGKAMNATNE